MSTRKPRSRSRRTQPVAPQPKAKDTTKYSWTIFVRNDNKFTMARTTR
ncbi:MAG: hypothetical protein IT462_07540 [Planctomycetes bacterium]|nr:hypothetical protein [Planctomycetota bacterium]